MKFSISNFQFSNNFQFCNVTIIETLKIDSLFENLKLKIMTKIRKGVRL